MDAHTGVSVLLLPLIRPVNEKIGKQEKLQLSVLACLCDFFPTASVAFYSTCESRGPNCHQLNNMCTLKSISRDQHHSKQKDMHYICILFIAPVPHVPVNYYYGNISVIIVKR